MDILYCYSCEGTLGSDTGKSLYQSNASFKTHYDKCQTYLLKHLDISKAYDSKDPSQTIPRTVSLGIALLNTVRESATEHQEIHLGHSIGEYVAAYGAGIISESTALEMAWLAGQAMAKHKTGAMAVIDISESLPSSVTVSGSLTSTLQTVSGPTDAIDTLVNEYGAKRLYTASAYHCPLMKDAVKELTQEFTVFADELDDAKATFISTLTGKPEKQVTTEHFAKVWLNLLSLLKHSTM